jgi:hypothetical protein
MRTTFNTVPVGVEFECNGNRCLKVSTRTARLLEYGRVFYFGMAEVVTVEVVK